MDSLITLLKEMPYPQAILLLLLENLLVFLGSVALGYALIHGFGHRRVSPTPEPLEAAEILLTISTILLNTLVTVVGLYLWREGWISFRTDVGLWALADVALLLLVMDAAMYWLHRIAHWASLYPWVHQTHRRYDKPRPLSLFVLNPAEALSFGGLWLVVIILYDASWLGMSLYLVLNILFGTIGHLGVEPFPERWRELPILKYITTSTFHAQHYCDPAHNFGFYTLLWDSWLGTLSPHYASALGRLQPEFGDSLLACLTIRDHIDTLLPPKR